jgi:signal transduction histidine kinase
MERQIANLWAYSRMQMSFAQGKFESSDITNSVDCLPPEGTCLRPVPRSAGWVDPLPESAGSPQSLTPDQSSALLSPLGQQIAQIVATTANAEILGEIAAAIGTELGVAACMIATVHPAPFQNLTTTWTAQPTTLPAAQVWANYPNLTAMVIEHGGWLTMPLLPVPSDAATVHPAAVLAVPLVHQGQVNGVLALLPHPAHSDAEITVAAVRPLVVPIANAIAQVLLHQQVQKQAQYQSLIHQLTLAMRNASDLPQILKLALDRTAAALQVNHGTVLRLKYWDPRQMLRSTDPVPRARVLVECEWQYPAHDSVIALHPTPTELPLSNSFWVADCALCQQIFTNAAEPLVLNDSTDFPTLTTPVQLAPIFNPEAMPAVLLVPLESKHRILGFLALQQNQPRTWQPEEIELAELVAAQLSSAIMQTETLRQVESLVEERTAQLQQSLELQAKLYEITRKQIEKLRTMNQRMDEFLSTLSHELRTPLTSMMLAIRMLREEDLSADRRLRYLNILEQQCTQETHLVNDLLALQELETNQVAMQVQSVNLTEMLAERTQSFEQQWLAKGLMLTVGAPAQPMWLQTDRASLDRILLELLTNAGKYSDPGSTVQLTVAEWPEQLLMLKITNQGAGIAAEELPHIFEKFRRCQGMTQNAVPGTGLGLALVKSLVQHLNGTITATSTPISATPSCETCFTVTLPQTLEVGKS